MQLPHAFYKFPLRFDADHITLNAGRTIDLHTSGNVMPINVQGFTGTIAGVKDSSGDWDNTAPTLQALRDFDRAVAELVPAGALLRDTPLTNPMTCTRTNAAGEALVPGDGVRDTLQRTAHGSFDGDALVVLRSLERIRRSPLLKRAIDLSEVP